MIFLLIFLSVKFIKIIVQASNFLEFLSSNTCRPVNDLNVFLKCKNSHEVPNQVHLLDDLGLACRRDDRHWWLVLELNTNGVVQTVIIDAFVTFLEAGHSGNLGKLRKLHFSSAAQVAFTRLDNIQKFV